MDSKDRKILAALRQDASRTVREISRKTGVRPSTVHKRISRLKEDGVIERFTVKLNDEMAGEGFTAFMFVKTRPSTEIGPGVTDNPHVREVFGITGEHDLLMKMKFRDVSEFNDFVIEFRKKQKIESTLTMVATAKIKEDV
jgi:DNA-binding Lrp family transcriptional regulator